MQIQKVLKLRGPNIWANFSCLEVWIDLEEFKDTSSEMIPGFNERLMGWLPTMIEHRCSVGERGGVFERLRRGTFMGNIRIDTYRKLIASQPNEAPDASLGRAVFGKTCQQCHTLYGVGNTIGPNLTGANRQDPEYLLTNIVDPSAVIAKEYQATVVTTTDGRVITGIVSAENDKSVTLRTATETIVLPK